MAEEDYIKDKDKNMRDYCINQIINCDNIID